MPSGAHLLGPAQANRRPSGQHGLRMLAAEHDRQRYYTLSLGEGLPREKIGRLV